MSSIIAFLENSKKEVFQGGKDSLYAGLERDTGIEPVFPPWEGGVEPPN